jgi:hypothetical protein
MFLPTQGDASYQRPAQSCADQKQRKNEDGDQQIRKQGYGLIDDSDAGLPRVGKSMGMRALLGAKPM